MIAERAGRGTVLLDTNILVCAYDRSEPGKREDQAIARREGWDAQIWAVARLHGIPAILSEDFSSGSVVDGVGFLNPFLPDFRISDWGE